MTKLRSLMLASAWQDLDYVVVMSVNPGSGGQPFLVSSVEKIRRLRFEAREAGSGLAIEVDGGVDAGNAAPLAAAGAEVLVAGSAVFGSADPAAAIGQLREAAGVAARA